MFRLMIIYIPNAANAITSQVVDFDTEVEADAVRAQLLENRYTTVLKLYPTISG